MSAGDAARSQNGSGKSEGEREKRVLPLDHLQGGSDAAEEGHEMILAGRRYERGSLRAPFDVATRLANMSAKFRRNTPATGVGGITS